ncbi:MAG: hypothetical protein J7619_09400 [Dyadobacter sp.]|uniref:hypothetical protein n=1 Tax=Dyadobacter sp. TaxID=1914288 RepID=UPI001B094420|nr:hypothetical protein [Dyadobacter sp.]MBO9612898.1 hypothetical protein [Dyadobacter sp.]
MISKKGQDNPKTSIEMNFGKDSEQTSPENLRVSKDGLAGRLKVFTGQQGDFVVSIVPSLNVSGYGHTEAEAMESLRETLGTFFIDLFELPEVQRHRELNKLGWEAEPMFKKKFSKAFIDQNGVLQDFDNPEQVKTSILTAA